MAIRDKNGMDKQLCAAAFYAVVLGLSIGCKSTPPPGPLLALYQKDGGPVFEKVPGTYDSLVVGTFFRSHPDLLPSFVDHGVCSLKIDSTSPEAMPNEEICQEAMVVSMQISMRKDTENNRQAP